MLRLVPTVAVSVIAALALAACGGGHHNSDHSAQAGAPRVTVSVSGCGTGWTNGSAGLVHLVLANTDTRDGEVMIVNPQSGAVFADVEPLAPGTSRDMQLSLSAGQYAVRCAMEDESAITGPTVTLTGDAHGTAVGVLPIAQAALVPATNAYTDYVLHALPGLIAATSTMRADIARGDLATARADWLTAHLDYERLGAAYGAFGDLDGAINGLPNGLPAGVNDHGWTGFHRIEYGLWHGQKATALAPLAQQLVANENGLATALRQNEVDPLELSIRAHEITENTIQFELTGETDFGSHSGLATAAANLDGTKTVLGILHSLLVPRYPQLSKVNAAVASTQADIAALHTSSAAAWPNPLTLPQATRERIDSDEGALVELLAPIAAILEPRRTS